MKRLTFVVLAVCAVLLCDAAALSSPSAAAVAAAPTAYRVLAVSLPFSGHANPVLAICRGLLARGHNVTFVTAGSFAVHSSFFRHPTFTYINVPLSREHEELREQFMRPTKDMVKWATLIGSVSEATHLAISVGLLDGRTANGTARPGDFDLVLSNEITGCAFDLADALSPRAGERLPVALQSLILSYILVDRLHLPYGPVFPHFSFPLIGAGWLIDRVVETLSSVLIRLFVRQDFHHLSMRVRTEVRRLTNYSITVDPHHDRYPPPLVLMSRPRPLDTSWGLDPPHVHRVGILTPPVEGLSADLQSWLDASDEVLYVSLGTAVLPLKEEIGLMADALNRFVRSTGEQQQQQRSGVVLRRRVLWSLKQKYHAMVDTAIFPESAVRIESWVAQRDVLQHPKVKAFFTHGGYNSISEAAVFGKPILGVPFIADQPWNVELMIRLGLGEGLDYQVMSDLENGAREISDALLKVWNERAYFERATRMAKILGPADQGVERSVELLEYMLRVDGSMDLFTVHHGTTWGYALFQAAVVGCFLAVIGLLLLLLCKAVVRLLRWAAALSSSGSRGRKSKLE